MKKFILIILCALFLFSGLFLMYACNSDDNDAETSLASILKDLRTNGMNSWWDVLAVYNANENPIDYKGFDEILESLESAATTLDRAAYVIVTNIAVAIGADPEYFEEYENYKRRLRTVLENPDGGMINDYIFAYLAIMTSTIDVNWNDSALREYFEAAQKADGGFALSGSEGDADVTAFMIPVLKFLYDPSIWAVVPPEPVMAAYKPTEFLRNNINEDGTFTSWGSANANSTAVAISGLISYFHPEHEIIKQAQEGLSLFEKSGGYAFTQGTERDNLSTAQGAIALGDLKNGMNVWIKLYLEMREAIDFIN